MYDEQIDHRDLFGRPDVFQEAGTGRHRAPADVFLDHPVPADLIWDPAEELAFMLQDAMEENREPRPRIPAARREAPVTDPAPGTPMSNLQEITAELPPLRQVSGGHRRARGRRRPGRLRVLSLSIAGLAAVVASAVSLFGGIVAYSPLHFVAASRASSGVVPWWPLLVYGPWLVGALSVLRAALHQRRAVHSWCVVLFFSATAVLMCVLQSPRSVTGQLAAALPCIASLACFQQLVRLITLTRPPRRTTPRHRLRGSAPEAPGTGPAPAPPGRAPQVPPHKAR
ncbi:DUF2637 domain-containing protein [Streptomyces sp. NPDC085946]|uniref:DUF2637 domain-containing protein n=1 Tax=Streptomyces sp. NPDC085946 TaxID=3365744 RepID=UPI0037D77981